MKKWIFVLVIIALLFLGVIGFYLKAKSDIESIINSNYIVLFLDDENKVNFVVAGDMNMFDDIENNAVDNTLEKDGIYIYDAITKLGVSQGEEKVKEILGDNNISAGYIVLVKDSVLNQIYPEEKIDITGSIPIEMRLKDIVSLFKGETSVLDLPAKSPYGDYYTNYTKITTKELRTLPLMFQILLADPESKKSFNIFIYGRDLENLCVNGVLKKTFIVMGGKEVVARIPATVTLDEISKSPLNDPMTVRRYMDYRIEIDSNKMIEILRDSKNIDIDVLGNYKTKAWIFHRFPKKEVDKELILEIIKGYKKEDIQIYPSNFTLRSIKFVPDSILKFIIDRYFSSLSMTTESPIMHSSMYALKTFA